MTINQALKLAAAELKSVKIILPHLEAEILLSSILKKPREFLLAHEEKQLSKTQIAKYQQLLTRRLKGEPVAYLTGHKEFYGLDFTVNKNVLIPRPETELIVEEALKLVTHNSQLTTLVDVGTGSCCIIIALARLLNHESRIMNHGLMAIDISPKALAVAKKNARIHQANKKIKFIKGDLLEPILKNYKLVIGHWSLVILANLPYGWKAWKNNCSLDTKGLKFEPEVALFTDKKGLGLYEKLFKQINCLIHNTKYIIQNTIYILCEFDPRQTVMMKKLIKQELPQAKFQIKKDLAGLNRLAVIQINELTHEYHK